MNESRSPVQAGSAPVARAGAQALSLLANPLNVRVLRAHDKGPLRLTQLQKQVGWPPQSTLRVTIDNLRAIGVLARRQLPGAPYAVVNELTPAGAEMLPLADTLDAWLTRAPDGPTESESNAAKTAIKTLAEGWSSSIIRMLAFQPVTLTDLNRSIPEATYPSLERRLARMRIAGQVEPVTAAGRGTPYEVTEWLRRSVGPLCGAARWEQRHLGSQAPTITGSDIETVLLLSIGLPLRLPGRSEGRCLLAVHERIATTEAVSALAGLMVEAQAGRVISAVPMLDDAPPNWVLGTPEGWLDALLDGSLANLRLGGNAPQLGVSLAQGLYFAL